MRVMEIVASLEAPDGVQVISNVDPAEMNWSEVGAVIGSKPAVASCARADEANATTATMADEKSMLITYWVVEIIE